MLLLICKADRERSEFLDSDLDLDFSSEFPKNREYRQYTVYGECAYSSVGSSSWPLLVWGALGKSVVSLQVFYSPPLFSGAVVMSTVEMSLNVFERALVNTGSVTLLAV